MTSNSDLPVSSDELLESARQWMADALDAYRDDVHRRVPALAPLSLEHLGKALLAKRDPVLLLQLGNGHESSLLLLAGHGRPGDRSKLRTIGLSQVLSRVAMLIGEPPTTKADVAWVVEQRNGAMHVGEASQETSLKTLATVLRLTQWMLEDLAISTTEFFGEGASLAGSLLDQRATAMQRSVTKRMQAAKAQFERLVSVVTDADDRARLVASLEERVPERPWDFDEPIHAHPQVCPSCGSSGRLSGPVDLDVDGEAEPDGDGGVSYNAWVVIEFKPDEFDCGVCSLALRGKDELDVAGIGEAPEVLEQDLEFDPSYVMARGDFEYYEDYGDD